MRQRDVKEMFCFNLRMVVPFFFLEGALKETVERTARDNNVKWSLKAQ